MPSTRELIIGAGALLLILTLVLDVAHQYFAGTGAMVIGLVVLIRGLTWPQDDI